MGKGYSVESKSNKVKDDSGSTNGESEHIDEMDELNTYLRIGENIVGQSKHAELWKINEANKTQLRSTWNLIMSDMESIGVVMFLKMFETHPETLSSFIKNVYSIKEIEMNEWYQENLKLHAIRVMAVVEQVMHRLDEEGSVIKILMKRGLSHKRLGVQRSMLEKMGRSFVLSIQTPLEEANKWDDSVEQAWLSLFRFVEFWMGLVYIEPDRMDLTLGNIVKDPRLPGGAIDTEHINDSSRGGARENTKTQREILAEMMSDTTGLSIPNNSDNDRLDWKEGRPPWLK